MGSVETFSASASQPARVWIARQASSQRETTAPRLELGAELRRDGDPSLVVHRVPVLAGEHLTGFPRCGVGRGARGAGGVVFPTLGHFHHFRAS